MNFVSFANWFSSRSFIFSDIVFGLSFLGGVVLVKVILSPSTSTSTYSPHLNPRSSNHFPFIRIAGT